MLISVAPAIAAFSPSLFHSGTDQSLPSQASPAATSVWWVGASSADPSALPNSGVRGTILVVSVPISNVFDVWVSDGMSNSLWGQVGYVINGGSTPWAFWQVWDLSSNTILGTGSTSVTTGYHVFSMYLQSGTTWAFAVDGSVIGTYNMGTSTSSSSYPVYALTEEQASSVFSIPSITFGPAMEVLRSGTWGSVASANTYGTAWGVQGQSQNPALPSDEIVVGGSLPALPSGTKLWGSSTTTTSTTSLPAPTTTVTASVTTTTTATQATTATITSTKTATSTVTSTATTTATTTETHTTTNTVTSTLASISTTTVTYVSTTVQTATTTSTVTLPAT